MTYRTLPKALSLAFVMAAASFGSLLVPGTALADPAKEASAPAKTETANDAKPKHAAKTKKAKKGATAKAHAKPTAHAKSDKADKSDKTAAKPAKAKRTASRENKASAKRAKAPAKADGDSPQPGGAPKTSCVKTPVSLDRGGVEAEKVVLVDCQGSVLDGAIAKVSVLARPWGAARGPIPKSKRVDGSIVARIDAVAKKFPGRSITLVGAPSTTGSGSSAHQAGRAVDLRVDGVDNQKLAEMCRTLTDTGCGFYPNASFVHIDVRAKDSGKAYWIDASEPGEPPRYVTSWPPASASTAKAEPSKTEPAKGEPNKAEPSKAEPAKADPPAK